jgi:hypothetical protein
MKKENSQFIQMHGSKLKPGMKFNWADADWIVLSSSLASSIHPQIGMGICVRCRDYFVSQFVLDYTYATYGVQTVTTEPTIVKL